MVVVIIIKIVACGFVVCQRFQPQHLITYKLLFRFQCGQYYLLSSYSECMPLNFGGILLSVEDFCQFHHLLCLVKFLSQKLVVLC